MPAAPRLLATLLDTFFPRRCALCGVFDTWACDSCLRTACTPRIEPWNRPFGASRISQSSKLISLGLYHEPLLAHLMDLYKFHNARDIGDTLGTLLALGTRQFIQQHYSTAKPIILIPIPLHRKRIRERGFNQNARIAHALFMALGVAQAQYRPDLLQRTRYTTHQTTVATKDRAANIAGAFALHPDTDRTSVITGSHILLIDDIATTGATLNEATQVIMQQHPASIDYITALRSSAQTDLQE